MAPELFSSVLVKRLDADLPLPSYAHAFDAGVDLYTAEELWLGSGASHLVPTGIQVAIPEGMVGFVMPRSGLAFNYKVTVLNAPGVVDSGYRGEVKVLLINHGQQMFHALRGERIAQMVFQKVEFAYLAEVDALPDSDRGLGGFGSTGV